MVQQQVIGSRAQKMSNMMGALVAFFNRDDTPDWEAPPGSAPGSRTTAMSGDRHQTRRLEKSQRRMRKVSQRANRG
jgi:hypothetical protein